MKTRCTITLALLSLAGCTSGTPPTPLKPVDQKMNCKQIDRAIEKAENDLRDVKIGRSTIRSEDVGAFIMDFGAGQYYMNIYKQEVMENRVKELQTLADSKRCTITQ